MRQFFAGSIPKEAHLAFDPVLFNTPAHQQLQSTEGWLNFYWLEGNEVVAFIPFCLKESEALNPLRSPFGGFEFSDKLPTQEKIEFVKLVLNELLTMGVKKIQIKQPPSRDGIAEFLATAGFELTSQEPMMHLPVNQNFSDKLFPAKQRRLQKLKDSGFKFEVLPSAALAEVHAFLVACRHAKGYTISLALDALMEMQHQLPEGIKLFAVRHVGNLAAASIAMRINSTMLYDYAHDHVATFDGQSPVILLLEGMAAFAQANGYEYLNLGASLDEAGNTKHSLHTFKKEIGGEAFFKTTWQKVL